MHMCLLIIIKCTKKSSQFDWINLLSGNVLLSQAAARQVPSTLEDFTSVFGMGTGVAPPPSSLDIRLTPSIEADIDNKVARRL